MSSHPLHHTHSGYQNPWPTKTTLVDSLWTVLGIPLTRARPFETAVEPVKTVRCDFDLYNSQERRTSICTTWLGHAVSQFPLTHRRFTLNLDDAQGFLVQLPQLSEAEPPIRIIFDPIFAERASPSTWFGPRRYLPTPCDVTDLPSVDFVVISHNQYVLSSSGHILLQF